MTGTRLIGRVGRKLKTHRQIYKQDHISQGIYEQTCITQGNEDRLSSDKDLSDSALTRTFQTQLWQGPFRLSSDEDLSDSALTRTFQTHMEAKAGSSVGYCLEWGSGPSLVYMYIKTEITLIPRLRTQCFRPPGSRMVTHPREFILKGWLRKNYKSSCCCSFKTFFAVGGITVLKYTLLVCVIRKANFKAIVIWLFST